MKIQVNSDKTISVDAGLTQYVEREVAHVLDRFDKKLTRVEVHLSDVDNKKTSKADKRCLVEARPRGDQPLSVSAKGDDVAAAVVQALGKMQRLLTTFFGRKGNAVKTIAPLVSPAKQVAAKKRATKKAATKKAAAKKAKPVAKKKAAAEPPAETGSGSPSKKRIYQARRKAWPAR
ncbi:MAG: HPF/RaiA family ribosome-associated protein [Acidobacteriota bacterium]